MSEAIEFEDFHSENPRDYENLGTMLCWHRRRNFGDDNKFSNGRELFVHLTSELTVEKAKTREEILARIREKYVILPVYGMDHTTFILQTYPFTGELARWDSGMRGWIYVSHEKIRKEYNIKKVTSKVKERVEAILNKEVEEYSNYINGFVE